MEKNAAACLAPLMDKRIVRLQAYIANLSSSVCHARAHGFRVSINAHSYS